MTSTHRIYPAGRLRMLTFDLSACLFAGSNIASSGFRFPSCAGPMLVRPGFMPVINSDCPRLVQDLQLDMTFSYVFQLHPNNSKLTYSYIFHIPSCSGKAMAQAWNPTVARHWVLIGTGLVPWRSCDMPKSWTVRPARQRRSESKLQNDSWLNFNLNLAPDIQMTPR